MLFMKLINNKFVQEFLEKEVQRMTGLLLLFNKTKRCWLLYHQNLKLTHGLGSIELYEIYLSYLLLIKFMGFWGFGAAAF